MADLIPMLAAAAGAGGAEPAGYQISRSLRFNSADSAYLNRTPASAGNLKTWTWSGWVKRSALASASYNALFTAWNGATGNDGIFFRNDALSVSFGYTGTGKECYTTAVFRDISAWYHIVISCDTTNATASDRLKVYVNNVLFTLNQYPNLDQTGAINTAQFHNIGRWYNNTTAQYYFNGYMTEVHFVDGQALTPSDFGETDATTGVWKPKAYTGSYGTNGFYLDFSDNSGVTAATLGADSSGNGNNWTPNNFSVTAGAGNDSLVDTPTPYGTDTGAGGEVRGNYCTLNPLDKGADFTLTNGNLQFEKPNASGNWDTVRATIGITSGKWYWEFVSPDTLASGGVVIMIGIGKSTVSLTSYLGNSADGYAYYFDGTKWNNNSSSSYGATWTANDVIGVAFDADSGTLTFYKNGVSQGTAFTGLTSGPYFPSFSCEAVGTTGDGIANFGQRPFAYTAPSGFKALCTQNLPDPTVVQGDDYFNTVLYTGNGSTNAITGVGFQPDIVWPKDRSAVSSHRLFDAVRGVTKGLNPNGTNAEFTESGVTSFDSDGFTLGSAVNSNASGNSFVAWNWNAGGSNATNTDGTITSTVRANPTAGFSIVAYTGIGGNGNTFGHGLGVKPNFIFSKCPRNGTGNWHVFHSAVMPYTTDGKFMRFNTTDALLTDGADNVWEGASFSSTVVGVGNANNVSGSTYIAYCFAEVEGFSKFGSYTGNGSANGPFVYCGFRPAFVMIKRTNDVSNWTMRDTERDTYNVSSKDLYVNSSGAESSAGPHIDIVSNGFKCRDAGGGATNASGSTYIYMAFAENPFKYALAR